MKHFIFAIAALVAVCADAGEISVDGLDSLPPADVYVLGEVHDNPLHHLGQARAIRAVKPKAVVFEMLSPEQAARITPDLLQDQAALEWEQSGWPDFAIYWPVFAALGQARVYGAARPRSEARRAFKEGAAAVFGAGYGLDQPLPKAQLEQRKQEQFADHCEAMPLELMGGMVEAQRFRDAAFADTVMQAYRDTGGPVVLITGNGHARKDWGVPSMLEGVKVLVVGFVEEPAEAEEPFDYWVVTKPAEREDPCLAFK
ncbi:ChaN family lipoprotein [Profundibacter sp.]|uniref:ChaN family lipoprotein n=1 Tax=Profundibacter sp. TaxID=3101071 RepID=UPI003D0B5AF8